MEPKICEVCGIEFLPTYRVKKSYWEKRRFCSDACKNKVISPKPTIGPRVPLQERFWSKVAVCEHGKTCRECCWPWTGATNKDGYGILYRTQKPKVTWYRAHCVAYELFIGPIPEGLHVLHDCPGGDKPGCVNYNGHLWTGTQADNNADRDKKGRGGHLRRRGERNGRAKVTDIDVAEIRRLYAETGISQARLQTLYNISESQIYRIVKYRQRT